MRKPWLHALSWFQPKTPLFYFSVDILNPNDLYSPVPGRITNNENEAFEAVDSWFSPALARRNPDPPDGLYWSLRSLKYVHGFLHKGSFRTGSLIFPGDYCIEYHGVYRRKSLSFVERLQIIPHNGKLIQLIDVWKGDDGTKIYSSSRPDDFIETPVPWLSNT